MNEILYLEEIEQRFTAEWVLLEAMSKRLKPRLGAAATKPPYGG